MRTTFDIIQYAKYTNKTGLLLLIDFEKAYDSISFTFINQALEFLDFCEQFIKWINILLSNFKAVVNHCGNIFTWAHLPYIAVLKSVHRTATVCSSTRTFFRGSKLLTVAVLWTLAKTANHGSSMDTFQSSCA